MPVRKFKTFEDAERALWYSNPDCEYYKKLCAFFKLFSRLSKFSYPKGVFKFRSLAEAEEHKMRAIVDSALNNSREVK